MLYRIYNKALDGILAQTKKRSLMELSESELLDFCEEERINFSSHYKGGKPVGFNKQKTVAFIIQQYTYSDYVPLDSIYISSEKREEIARLGFVEEMITQTHGDQTFELYAQHGLGFMKLMPRQEVELDLPERWVTEELSHRPYAKDLEIINLEKEEEVKAVSDTTSLDTDTSDMPYASMDFNVVRKIAKDRGMMTKNVSKQDILEWLAEHDEE
jgi:hypothetical protein